MKFFVFLLIFSVTVVEICLSDPPNIDNSCTTNFNSQECLASLENCAWCYTTGKCLDYDPCTNQTSSTCDNYDISTKVHTCYQTQAYYWGLFCVMWCLAIVFSTCFGMILCCQICQEYSRLREEKYFIPYLIITWIITISLLIYFIFDVVYFAEGTPESVNFAVNLLMYPIAAVICVAVIALFVSCCIYTCLGITGNLPRKGYSFV